VTEYFGEFVFDRLRELDDALLVPLVLSAGKQAIL